MHVKLTQGAACTRARAPRTA